MINNGLCPNTACGKRLSNVSVEDIDGGPDGMDIAWACLGVAARHLQDQGWLLIQLGTAAQADAVQEHLGSSPEMGLKMVEVREYGPNGVLVHVACTG